MVAFDLLIDAVVDLGGDFVDESFVLICDLQHFEK